MTSEQDQECICKTPVVDKDYKSPSFLRCGQCQLPLYAKHTELKLVVNRDYQKMLFSALCASTEHLYDMEYEK